MKRWAMGLVVLFGLSCGLVCLGADFTGDGTGEIAYFRSSSSLWAVREVTKIYFGSTGDAPIPGDYDGSGTDRAAYFRASSNLWAVRDVTRIYFGSSDSPKTGDYNGDGTEDFGYFRSSSGLWAVRGITRVYFGSLTDEAIAPGKARARGLLQTGQTFSYQTGDDGYYEKGIAFNYTDNGDGTVTDNVTGLMWASDGNDAGCFNGQTMVWATAVGWANTLVFADHDDWRLPNLRELESLANVWANPTIDSTYFPNTVSQHFWTSTTYQFGGGDYAWAVSFNNGGSTYWMKDGSDLTFGGGWARVVRGGR